MRQLLFAAALTALLLVSTAKKSKEDEEPLEPDELPEYVRSAPKIDMSKLESGEHTEGFEERQDAYDVYNPPRYILDDNRALFTFKDGSLAWEAKDFLVQEDQLETITIENKPYYGKNAGDKDLIASLLVVQIIGMFSESGVREPPDLAYAWLQAP
ncbi:hypothetical protein HPB50_028088 [Hyalomma asiaticum]|nr:hypothetical protein HPB50_028088 [Hyalomma asiaticum]